MKRREFLHIAAGAMAGALAPPLGLSIGKAASRGSAPPKIVLVRFGGGVRRQETISLDHPNYTPHLLHHLLPEGTLWENVEMHGIPTHSTGTTHLMAGVYYDVPQPAFLDAIVPLGPTIFELARKDLGYAKHEALYVNADSLFLELIGWSDDPNYGADFQPGVLSRFELRNFLAEKNLARTDLSFAERFRWRSEEPYHRHYRPASSPNERIRDFWEDHCRIYGENDPEGDLLAFRLASLALEELKPRLLMVNFQDVDFAHWGLPMFYKRGLNRTDECTYELFRQIQRDPYYRDDTYFIVASDCGRENNTARYLPYQHHQYEGSYDVFIYAHGPAVGRGVRVDRLRQQVDVAATIGALLGVQSPKWEGKPLDEFLV